MNIEIGECKSMVPTTDSPCTHYIPVANGSAGLCKVPTKFRCTQAIKELAMRLSHSTIQDYMKCKRLYWLKHVNGVVMKEENISSAMKAGSLMDLVWEMVYNEAIFDRDKVATIKSVEGKDVHVYEKDTLSHCHRDIINGYIYDVNVPATVVSKVWGIYRAYKEYITPCLDGFVGTQKHFELHLRQKDIKDVLIHGYYDVLFEDHFEEYKFTGQPEDYSRPIQIGSQVGTYFLANPALEYVDMMIVHSPQLKLLRANKKRADDETDSEYEERIYLDAVSRPSHYFKGFNRKTGTFGRRFYRSEFDLREIERRYIQIAIEIKRRTEENAWYKEDYFNCSSFNSSCEYMPVCESDDGSGRVNVSEEIFEIREKVLDR